MPALDARLRKRWTGFDLDRVARPVGLNQPWMRSRDAVAVIRIERGPSLAKHGRDRTESARARACGRGGEGSPREDRADLRPIRDASVPPPQARGNRSPEKSSRFSSFGLALLNSAKTPIAALGRGRPGQPATGARQSPRTRPAGMPHPTL